MRKEFVNVVTLREREVMKGLAQGFSTREIAKQLGLSFHTIETHRKKLLEKFNARNTVQMMLKAGKVMPPGFWV